MASKIGFVLGAVVGSLIGVWFTWITATAGHVADADLRLLGSLVALCVVVAVILALAAELSSFFPSLGLGFCVPAALASLVCAVISAFRGWWDAALRYAAVTLALVACFFIIRAIVRRIAAQG